jgi:tRNA(Ile)-lysidine synthase
MIFSAINSFVGLHNLIEHTASVVVGLSGGPDSLFLLHYLDDLRKQGKIKRVIAAHLDHQWRENSASDVIFCRTACEALGVEFVSARLTELEFPKKLEGSKEEIGRRARRFFLESVRKEHNADRIALAHHLQDQEETFFIRLVRGSSLTGLISMRPKHGIYIRPLLEISKTDILSYLNEHNIPYLTDPTNEHFDYLRNRIRATVLPALQAVDERFDQNFLITLNRVRDTEEFLEILTQTTLTSIATMHQGLCVIDIPALLALHPVMRYRVLMHWLIQAQVPFNPSQSFLDEIIRFLSRDGSKEHTMHESWKLVKKKNSVYIETR